MSRNDSKTQMRLNIKQHQQKLLQSLKSTDDTYLKPKIESVLNDIEKSHLNYDIKPKIEVIDHETSVTVIKKLSDQLIEEIQYYDSSDDGNGGSFEDSDDDNISVGIEDWNQDFQTHNESYLEENNKRNLKTEVEFDGQLVDDKINKTYLDNNFNSGTLALDVHDKNTRMNRRARKNINYFEKPEKIPQPNVKKLSMKWKDQNKRTLYNAKVKKSRDDLSELFAILKSNFSSFKSTRKVASMLSILIYAKKECNTLKSIEERLCKEKKNCQEQREFLQKKLDEIIFKS